MIIVRPAPSALLLVALATAAGCAKQPAKDVQSAQAELTSARQERRAELQSLDAEHSQERYEAQRRGATEWELTELHARQQRELAEAEAEHQRKLQGAGEDVEAERGELARAREQHRDTARARVAKLDAQASELHARSATLDAAHKSEFDRAWRAYTAQHQSVEGALRSLEAVSDPQWSTWRSRVDAQLDTLEDAVDQLEDLL